MKTLKPVLLLVLGLFLSSAMFASNGAKDGKEKTKAEDVISFALQMDNFDIDAFREEYHKLGLLQKASLVKKVLKGAKNSEMQHQAEVYEYILAIVLPPLGVGLHTNWQTKPLVSNILWCCLAYVPGVVHAFIVYNKY